MTYMTAAETVLLFDQPGRDSANAKWTQISFDMELADTEAGRKTEVAIWWRMNTQLWQKLDFRKVGIEDHPVNKGSFLSWNVYPGDVLQYRMYNDTVNPDYVPDTVVNETATRIHGGIPVWHTEIFGLFKLWRNAPDKLKAAYRPEKYVGGTYYGLKYNSPGINTNILFEVSQQEPIYGLPNLLRFTDPDRFSTVTVGAQQYDLQLMPMEPGTNYNTLIRYSDDQGNWLIEEGKFTSLRRQVTVRADSVHIDNDGDPMADGEASFTFQIGQGPTNTAIFFMGNEDFKVHSGQTIPLGTMYKLDTSLPLADQLWPLPQGPAEKTFGPFSTSDGLPAITVNAAGTEYDGLLESDEHTGGGASVPFWYPFGPGEMVIDQTDSVIAKPSNGNFEFTLNYRYSVTYV